MKISARNVLKGVVKSLKPGIVNTEVVIELPSGEEIVSVITLTSAESLGLEIGKPAYAVIKSSDIIVAID